MFCGKNGRWRLAMCFLMLVVFLSGCMVMNTADLLSLPRLLPDHADILKIVNDVTSGSNWTTTSPQSGTNRSPVQLVDLYQDGIPEAIVFLSNSIDVQLQVMILSKTGESKYTPLTSYTLNAVSFERVEYADVNGDGILEMIIGQSFGAKSNYTATVYTLVNDEPVAVLTNAPYTSLYVHDLNGDEKGELLLLNHDETGNNAYAELFGLNPGDSAMQPLGRAPLSAGVRAPSKIVGGRLNEEMPAVIVDGYSTAAQGMVSDVLILTEEGLVNISFDAIYNFSYTGRARMVHAMDVDFDGFLEIPKAVPMPQPQKVDVEPDTYLFWFAYDKSADIFRHAVTYQAHADPWYFLFPEEWVGRVYARHSESGGLKTTTFSMEYNGYQYDLLSIHVYVSDTRLAEADNKELLTQSQGRYFYVTIPGRSKLSGLPDKYWVNFGEVKRRFAILDSNGDNRRLAELAAAAPLFPDD